MHKDTQLRKACEKGQIEVVEGLIEKGVDVNKFDSRGYTPLILASLEGHKAIVEVLIKNGADVNKANNEGHTSLLCASFYGHKAIDEVLIKNGADVNKISKSGNSPLHAASGKGYKGIVKILIKNGADMNKTNNQGKTAFYIACESNEYEVIKLFLYEKKVSGLDLDIHTVPTHSKGLISFFQDYNPKHKEMKDLLRKAGAEEKKIDTSQSFRKTLMKNFMSSAQNTHHDNTTQAIGNSVENLRKAVKPDYLNGDMENIRQLSPAQVNARNEYLREQLPYLKKTLSNSIQILGLDDQSNQVKSYNRLFEKNCLNINIYHCTSNPIEVITLILKHTENSKQSIQQMANLILDTVALSPNVCAQGFFNASVSAMFGIAQFEHIIVSVEKLIMEEQQRIDKEANLMSSIIDYFLCSKILPQILFSADYTNEFKRNLSDALQDRKPIPADTKPPRTAEENAKLLEEIQQSLEETIRDDRQFLDCLRGHAKGYFLDHWEEFKDKYAPQLYVQEPREKNFRDIDDAVSHICGVRFAPNKLLLVSALLLSYYNNIEKVIDIMMQLNEKKENSYSTENELYEISEVNRMSNYLKDIDSLFVEVTNNYDKSYIKSIIKDLYFESELQATTIQDCFQNCLTLLSDNYYG